MRQPPPPSSIARYPVTGGLVILAVLVTLASFADPGRVAALYEDGRVRQGHVWLLLTSVLPHGDFLHLAFNAYWTWAFGTLVEEAFGHGRTLLTVAALAFASGGAQYAIDGGGIGLSGVGYGLFGLLWVLGRWHRRLGGVAGERFANAVDANTVGLFVAWFFLCIVLTATGTYAVGNVAHGAGALAGAAIGGAIVLTGGRREWAPALAGVGLAGVGVMMAVVLRPWVNFNPDSSYDEIELGYAALDAGRDAEAARWYADAVRIAPADAAAWYNLGVARERLGDAPAARAAFAESHRLDPSDDDARAALGQFDGGGPE